MREIVFDTETTGLNAAMGDRIVEIGCIELVNRVETGAVFHSYFNPERPMPAEAQQVHGLSDGFLSDKPRFSESAAELLDFLGDSPLVAHNAVFDFAFLNAELESSGLQRIGFDRMVDTLAIARRKHPGAKHNLDALCTRFGVDRSRRVLHGALLDAQLLAQVYVELTGGRQIGFGLEVEEAALREAGPALAQLRAERPFRAPRPHTASPEELERHRLFVAGLANPLWLDAPSSIEAAAIDEAFDEA